MIPPNNKKKKVGEARDILDAMGQRSEKAGIKWTKYFMELWDKKQWEENQIKKDKLKKSKKFKKIEYFRIVKEMAEELILSLERPAPGYWAEVGFTNDGVWVKLHDRFGLTWQRGIRPCGVPKIDFNALQVVAAAVDDKMWDLEKEPKTNSGIYLS